MKNFKLLLLFLGIIFISALPVLAVDGVKFHSEMCSYYNPTTDINNVITFKPFSDINYNGVNIKKDSIVKAKVESSEDAKRFHKSGFIKIKFLEVNNNNCIDCLADKNLYGIARKYDKIDKKEAAKTGAELTTTTVAGFLLPGIDIAYYFVKGAIQNTKADTRFKSGVHNAYDNSIMWVFLKGKSIELTQGDMITIIMYVDEEFDPNHKVKVKAKKIAD